MMSTLSTNENSYWYLDSPYSKTLSKSCSGNSLDFVVLALDPDHPNMQHYTIVPRCSQGHKKQSQLLFAQLPHVAQ